MYRWSTCDGSCRGHSVSSWPRYVKVCENRCRSELHECDRIHLSSIHCPPCHHPVAMQKSCGHICVYECHIATKMALSSTKTSCAASPQELIAVLPHGTQLPKPPKQSTEPPRHCHHQSQNFYSNETPQSQAFQPNQYFEPAGRSQAPLVQLPNPQDLLRQKIRSLVPVEEISMSQTVHIDDENIHKWIKELPDLTTRENALLQLVIKRDQVDLADILWSSYETISILLQEIAWIYPSIYDGNLTAQQSKRACNALALLQSVASNTKYHGLFLNMEFQNMLDPFLYTTSKATPYEYLRMNTLSVNAALIKSDEGRAIHFLLTTEMIAFCLRIMELMEKGSDLSANIATFILEKMLLNDAGLNCVCETFERFANVANVLGKMVFVLQNSPCPRLLTLVVRCYLRLSEDPRGGQALRNCLPVQLKDLALSTSNETEEPTNDLMLQLLKNIEESPPIVDAAFQSEYLE